MAPKNNYIKRQRKKEDDFFNAGAAFGMQIMLDCWQVVLNDSDVMGKSVIGSTRMKAICEEVKKTVDYFYDMVYIKDPEADVLQERLDARLRKIWKDDLVPYAKRYKMMKQCKY